MPAPAKTSINGRTGRTALRVPTGRPHLREHGRRSNARRNIAGSTPAAPEIPNTSRHSGQATIIETRYPPVLSDTNYSRKGLRCASYNGCPPLGPPMCTHPAPPESINAGDPSVLADPTSADCVLDRRSSGRNRANGLHTRTPRMGSWPLPVPVYGEVPYSFLPLIGTVIAEVVNMKVQNDPKVGKDVKFPFQVSIVSWGDLLGYGPAMAEAHFNPLDDRSKKSVRRLRIFHRIVAEYSDRNFPTLVVNDGAAAYRDLSLRTNFVGYDFVERAWRLFERINLEETKNNFPGMRMIVACGFRARGRRWTIENKHDKLDSILRRFRYNRLTAEQAIREAFTTRPSFDIVPQLQANFAFTKAYVADSTGKRSGLSGPNFYLDLSLLRRPLASWPQIDAQVQWKHELLGLDTCFGKVRDIPKRKHRDMNANFVRRWSRGSSSTRR